MNRLVANLCVFLLLSIAGCQHNPFMTDGSAKVTGGLVGYAEHLATLAPDERDETLAEARSEWQHRQTPMTRARLGLARSQWGHDGYAPEAAREDLNAALSDESATWSATERAFLNLRLHQLKRQVTQRRERRDLVGDKRRLQRSLENAKRKLEAISEIEEDLGNTGSNE